MATEQKIAGFEYRGVVYSGQSESPRRPFFYIKDAAETLRVGDMLNAEIVNNRIHVDLAVAADTALIGIADEYKVGGAAGTTKIRAIVDPDAVYAVKDDNARNAGDFLKLGVGTSGKMIVVATESGNDKQFNVVADSSADEWTLIRIAARAALRNSLGLPDALAPTVAIEDSTPDGAEQLAVSLVANLGADGTYDGNIVYAWTVSAGVLDDATAASPSWTRPTVGVNTNVEINVTITVAGTGVNARSGSSDSRAAAELTALVLAV